MSRILNHPADGMLTRYEEAVTFKHGTRKEKVFWIPGFSRGVSAQQMGLMTHPTSL